jgi:hypothetical protein
MDCFDLSYRWRLSKSCTHVHSPLLLTTKLTYMCIKRFFIILALIVLSACAPMKESPAKGKQEPGAVWVKQGGGVKEIARHQVQPPGWIGEGRKGWKDE